LLLIFINWYNMITYSSWRQSEASVTRDSISVPLLYGLRILTDIFLVSKCSF
jgi:hypothetical protein